MCSPRLRQLRDLARRNFAPLVSEPGLVAALVTGSVAHGDPDDASDIDTILYFDGPPGADRLEREKARAEASGGGFHGGTAAEGFGVFRWIEGVRCDFGFEPAAGVDSLIDDLVERADPDLDKQLVVLGIRESWVLAGEDMVAGWRARTDRYPEALARAMAEKHLKPRPEWIYGEMAAARGDRFLVAELALETARNLLGLLCAVNRTWNPGKLKGARAHLDTLPIAPLEAGLRIERLLTGTDPFRIAAETVRLWEETLELVERELPDVDAEPARRRLAMPLGPTSGE
jgi:hypothetical protein